jgi:hypothetical protein
VDLPQGPQALARRIAELDGEIARLVREIEQRRAVGDAAGDLRLQLDRAKRRRGMLEFYVVKDPASVGRRPEQGAPGGRSCLLVGCFGVLALAVAGGVVAYYGSLRSSSVEVSGPGIVEAESSPVAVEPEPVPAPAPTADLARFTVPIERTGRVKEVVGLPGLAPNHGCVVAVTPEHTRFNCRIIVRCGGEVLYGDGNGGYNRCAVEAGKPVGAQDRSTTDGDPACRLDLVGGTVEIDSDQPGQQFAITIRLDPPAGTDAGGAVPSARPAPPAPAKPPPPAQPKPPPPSGVEDPWQ